MNHQVDDHYKDETGSSEVVTSSQGDDGIVVQQDANENDDDVEDDDWTLQRDTFKYEGDTAYRQQHYNKAIHYYTMALSLDPNNGTIKSNRSAAYLKINYKSKALQDAKDCISTMGHKGISRYATALQALQRYTDALEQWQSILNDDPTYTAAIVGKQYCQEQIQSKEQQKEDNAKISIDKGNDAKTNGSIPTKDDPEFDELDDFFNDVEEVTAAVQTKKIQEIQQQTEIVEPAIATDAILHHKKELGTVQEQVVRLVLRPNYYWYNLNPFHVLDISYKSTKVDISRRYKALSLLLHPDRFNNSNNNSNDNSITKEQVQLAYDQVLNAKTTLLDDETKYQHIISLVEQGMNQGKVDYNKYIKETKKNPTSENQSTTLEEYQNRAIHRIFATIEHTRQQVLEREKSFFQKEQEASDSITTKERNIRTHDQQWQQSDRVDTRIDDWRSFQTKSKKLKKT